MRKPVLLFTALILFSNYLFAQNSMVGDGFGGRGWYVPNNYRVGSYSAFTVCGDSNQLYGWGSNFWREMGVSASMPASTPVAIQNMSNIKFHTTGYYSVAIKNDNSAWVWGRNFSDTPRNILTGVKFADAGIDHFAFVKQNGTVWGAGSNWSGQLGNGDTSQSRVFVPVQMQGITNAVRAVTAGKYLKASTIILLSDSTVAVTGNGFQEPETQVPVKMNNLNGIIDVKAGAWAAYALNSNGEVFSFGYDQIDPQFSQYSIHMLGLGDTTGFYFHPPSKITFPVGAAPIVAISAKNDGYGALALDSNHNVYGWGLSNNGQFGTSAYSVNRPILVFTDAIDILAGETFNYILKSDGTLWASGSSNGVSNGGSIWMNLSNIQRNAFTQIDPTIPPLNLCAPKIWTVVPIKLSNFICIANGNHAYLNWQSAEETNADRYIIEYSSDGRNFRSIATVIAKGSNSKYSFIHHQVSGTAFYRLKMVDKDGSFTYSEIRAIKFDNKNGFTIAPNPANNVIHLYTKSSDDIKSVQLFSAEGKLLQSISSYQNSDGVNINKLSRGAYIVKVVFKNETVEYGRFVKM